MAFVLAAVGGWLPAMVPTAAAREARWQAPQFARRAVVRVIARDWFGRPVPSNVDVAAARLLTLRATQASGDDIRVFDDKGDPVAYQLTFHQRQRLALISFRAPKPRTTYYIYFGDPTAGPDPASATVPPLSDPAVPQPGPAANGWIPRAGMVLMTMFRSTHLPDPDNLGQMFRLIRSARDLDGGGYRRHISDGFNPFGASDRYISVYRGWLRIPKTGRYGFCTASDDASFSFLDGRHLVDWPGSHGVGGGAYGQKNTTRYLKAGMHYIEYLQENGQGKGQGIAFLGWKPPGAGHYEGIPQRLFVQPYRALVLHYEDHAGLTVTIEPTLRDSVWPHGRPGVQYTRYKFAVARRSMLSRFRNWTLRWQFGDGQTATGASVEHVFMHLGTYPITLDATSPEGRQVRLHWPLTVYLITRWRPGIRRVRQARYQPLVKTYRLAALHAPSLAGLAHFEQEIGDLDRAGEAATLALGRSALAPDERGAMYLVATREAGSEEQAWRNGSNAAVIQRAIVHLDAADKFADNEAQRMTIAARLIRLVGVAQGKLDAAVARYATAKRTAARQRLRGSFKEAFRDATIAIGDAYLLAGKTDDAINAYRRAESMSRQPVSINLRDVRVGAYAESVSQAIGHHQLWSAVITINRWYDQFPADQLNGQLLFYIGKVALLEHHADAAVRPLTLAATLGQGSRFEAEARWLLAQAYGDVGNPRARIAALRDLVKAGITGPFRDKALKALGMQPRQSTPSK